MATVREVLTSIERIAPARFAFSFDRIGLQLGDPNADVQRAVVSLDSSLAAAEFAIEHGAQLLVSHHPLIWDPLKAMTTESREGRVALRLAQHGIAFVACHTNWDCAPGGINDTLARLLSLNDVHAFGMANPVEQFKVSVFAPPDPIPSLLEAMSEAGAGVIGNYSHCSWRSMGTGSFIGGEGANPSVGEAGRLEEVSGEKLEMVVPGRQLEAVVAAMRSVHPYEEPAFDCIPIRSTLEQPGGRIGSLPKTFSLAEFLPILDARLGTRALLWGDPDSLIDRVAVVGGAADSEWKAAKAAGAELFVTGEVKQNVALEAAEFGMAIVAAGHYATEQPGMAAFAERMRAELPNLEWTLFEPGPGMAGRPL